jgi:hypothetical protein
LAKSRAPSTIKHEIFILNFCATYKSRNVTSIRIAGICRRC